MKIVSRDVEAALRATLRFTDETPDSIPPAVRAALLK